MARASEASLRVLFMGYPMVEGALRVVGLHRLR